MLHILTTLAPAAQRSHNTFTNNISAHSFHNTWINRGTEPVHWRVQ